MLISDDLIPLLDEMLYELHEQRLEVCLVPGNNPEAVKDGRMIRAAVSKNPHWYQDLCNMHPCTRIKRRSERKDYTKIKRQDTIKILEWLIKNKKSRSMYAPYLIDVAQGRKELYEQIEKEENAKLIPWDNQF